MLIKSYCALLLFFISVRSFGQNPAPIPAQTNKVLLIGGTAHIGNGTVIENSALAFANGQFTFVMDARGFRPDPRSFDTIIYIHGKHVYPGFIAMNSDLGLREIELVRSTNDYIETGNTNPSARALIAYNTDSKVIPTVRSNGVLMAQIVPQGGLISGTSSLVQLDAWNWEDAMVKADEGIFLNWPSMRVYKSSAGPTLEEQKEKTEKQLRELQQLFSDAKSYSLQASPETNQHFEAMRGLFNGTKKMYVRCHYIKEIIAAVQFCENYKVKMVLVGGMDSWHATDLLKENNIPVIITRTHALPRRDDDDIDLPYKLPSLLYQAGIKFCIADEGFWQQRNVPFQAGTAITFGLPYEEAVRSITLSPAEIIGVEKTCGTLEDSKEATFIITTGDALDIKTSVVEEAYIHGRKIDLDNIQKQLYHKYQKKYGWE